MSDSRNKDQYFLEIESEKYQAEIYNDTYYKQLLAYQGYKIDVMRFLSDLPTDIRLLDVGCGTGWFLSMLQRYGYTRLVGLDISPDMLRIAKNMVPEAEFHEAPIQEYADSCGEGYDVITCLGVIHHMPDIGRVAQSLYALLKPGGVLCIHEPNKGWFYEQSKLLRGVLRIIYAPLRIKNSRRIHALRAPWKEVPPSPYHEDIEVSELLSVMKHVGFIVEKVAFKNTVTRVFEGMLFRASSFDRWLYNALSLLDQRLLDGLAGQRAGAFLIRLYKPL